MLAPRICPECQTSNPPQAAFCFGCGKPLQQAVVTPALLHQRYHLLHKLGTGGFGAVYQAKDTQLGKRLVAIKEMSSQSNLSTQENAEATEAFKQEAFMLAELMHPNLPRIYDHFYEDGHWYLVMDYIEGATLEEYLAQTPGGYLPLQEVLEMGLQLCKVLEYLHTRQPAIIFRDLKPLNIMRTPSGHLYLIDFGIARHFKPGQAKDTIAFGSPGYAAPEQYGKTQTTPRSDIYSLGATLHQMLTSIDPSLSPFRFAPLCLPEGKPTPEALATLLASMLEMDEIKRPASMSVIKAELRTIATSVASGSFVSIEPTQIPAPPSSRGKLRAIHQRRERRIYSIVWSPDSTLVASAGESNVIDIWNAETNNTEHTYQKHGGDVRVVAWSPDGKYIASAGVDKTVQIWSPASGNRVLLYHGHTHTITGLTWSPDSQYIASCSLDHSVQVWSRDKGHLSVKYERHHDIVYRVAWSPDGKYIASPGYNGNVKIWEALSGRDLLAYTGHIGEVLALGWSPDGKSIASGGNYASLQIWEAVSGRILQNCNVPDSQILSLSWSPDGKQLVSGGTEEEVRIWDVDTGQIVFVYSDHVPPPNPYAIPAYTANYPYAIPTRTSNYPSQPFVRPTIEISAVAWSPNGDWIVSGDSTGFMRVWTAH